MQPGERSILSQDRRAPPARAEGRALIFFRKPHSEEASQSGSPEEEASWAAPSQQHDGEAGLSTFEFKG
jgi:hypothetical protein